MKHILRFNEAKVVNKDTRKYNYNVGSLIQIVDDNDKNIGQAKIKKALKTIYHVEYKSTIYRINKKDIVTNIHGQIQTNIENLK